MVHQLYMGLEPIPETSLIYAILQTLFNKNKLRGLSRGVNYTDRGTAACWRS
jgi:hypothetical protein